MSRVMGLPGMLDWLKGRELIRLVVLCMCVVLVGRGRAAESDKVALVGLESKSGKIMFYSEGKFKGVLALLESSDGVALAKMNERLFNLKLVADTQLPLGDPTWISDRSAGSVALQFMGEGEARQLQIEFGDFEHKALRRVVCRVGIGEEGGQFLWWIDVELADGWLLEQVMYPYVTLLPKLGSSTADNAVVLGHAKGGVHARPGDWQVGKRVSAAIPGTLAAQFGCYYSDRAGFYTAALDPVGQPKGIVMSRTKTGIEMFWHHNCNVTGEFKMLYPVAAACYKGRGGAVAGWRDAADIYKSWVVKQDWCKRVFTERDDLPRWLREGPAMVRFGRSWLADSSKIERWIENFWRANFPDMHLITAYWGWEKHGAWITPDYFPLFPSDEEFKALAAKTRSLKCHPFPWPSGYHWTLTYIKQEDGNFKLDQREEFNRVGRKHAVVNRDGEMYLRTPGWLQGGNTACLCGGDPWTIEWWNSDICVPLAERGCDMIQIDQVVGAAWPPCYSSEHGHARGHGVWMTEAFARQLVTMRKAMQQHEPEAVVCFEEPNEYFNHLVGLQDYRDCEFKEEWASVFNYIYHEYLPCFQSNPRSGDRVMDAYCAADGQMPHILPRESDIAVGSVLINGDFEVAKGQKNVFWGWDKVAGYQGVQWLGSAISDTEVKHSGNSSLRLENSEAGEIVQVSQNISFDEMEIAKGDRFVLSAWLKSGEMPDNAAVNCGMFAAGMKSLGSRVSLKFPTPDKGWQRVSVEFSVPEGTSIVRIMCHAGGKTRVWIDGVQLERVKADGSRTEVCRDGMNSYVRFALSWVELYHGRGRPWLAHGKLCHPLELECKMIDYGEKSIPAVFHNVFEAADGHRAVVFANATKEAQSVSYELNLRKRVVQVPADIVLLVEL